VAALVASVAATAVAAATPMVRLPEGDFMPFFQASAGKGKAWVAPTPVRMPAFRLDVFPVTNGEFLEFVRQHPEWRRSRIKPLFADQNYLTKWRSDLTLPDEAAAAEPVTNVSWFAAEAYCEARGLQLPTTDQWEYALADLGRKQREISQQSLDWFSVPNPARLSAVGQREPNGYGVHDMVEIGRASCRERVSNNV
jgi:sulfatase modifying factor 1